MHPKFVIDAPKCVIIEIKVLHRYPKCVINIPKFVIFNP